MIIGDNARCYVVVNIIRFLLEIQVKIDESGLIVIQG